VQRYSSDNTIIWDLDAVNYNYDLDGASKAAGATFLSGTQSGLALWDSSKEEPIKMYNSYGGAAVIALPGNYFVASSYQHRDLELWRFDQTSAPLRLFVGHTLTTYVLAHVQGNEFLSGSGDRTIMLWDMSSETSLMTFFGHTSWVLSLAVSPSKSTFISGDFGGTIFYWDTNNVQPKAQKFAGQVRSLVWIDDSNFIAACGYDNSVTKFKIAKGAISVDRLYTFNDQARAATSVLKVDDSSFIATIDNGYSYRWLLNRSDPVTRYGNSAESVTACSALLSDGTFLTGGQQDSLIRRYNLKGMHATISFSSFLLHSSIINLYQCAPASTLCPAISSFT
jgi:WD40 repeat protein